METFSEDDLNWVHRAIMLTRDVAFLNTHDKNHPTVKRWEELGKRVQEQLKETMMVEGNRD
jgi:hypothetical protein